MTGLPCGTSERLNYGMLNWLNSEKKMEMTLAHSLLALYEFFRNCLEKSSCTHTPDTRHTRNRRDNNKKVAGLRKSATLLRRHKESSEEPEEQTLRHNHRKEPQAAVLDNLRSEVTERVVVAP